MTHLALSFLLAAGLAVAQDAPTPKPEIEFMARDTHQGVTIAARPVPDTPEAEKIFGTTACPTRAGFLPVEILLENNRPEPIEIVLTHIVINSGSDDFEQVSPDTVASWLYPPPDAEVPKVGGGPRLPIPWPRGPKKTKDKHKGEREEAEAALRSRQLRARQVAPGAHARGFLYFDLRGESIDLTRAAVFVPEVNAVKSGEGLLFYEISLKAYALP